MKLVDKKCDKCSKVFEDLFDDDVKCACGGSLIRLYRSTRIEIFKPGYYENFELEPIYIDTKKQFQKECDKRGLVRVF
jgi:hypothetical protein